MSEAFESLFGQPSGSEATSEVQAEAPAVEPVSEGPARGPDGKFVSAASEAPPVAETPPAATPEAETPPEQQHAPITALLDERDKRKAAQAEADALKKQLAEIQAAQKPQGDPLPPEAAVQQALHAQKLMLTRRLAEREYGKDTIATVHEWAEKRCATDPAFNNQMLSSDDPYEAAYQAYNRAQLEPLIAGVTPEAFAAFRAWQAAQAAGQPPPNQTHQSPPESPIPRTLATAPGNGSAGASGAPVGPGTAFGSIFSKG